MAGKSLGGGEAPKAAAPGEGAIPKAAAPKAAAPGEGAIPKAAAPRGIAAIASGKVADPRATTSAPTDAPPAKRAKTSDGESPIDPAGIDGFPDGAYPQGERKGK